MGIGTSATARAEALIPLALEGRYAARTRTSFAVKTAILLWCWAALDAAAHYDEEAAGLRPPPPLLSAVRAVVPDEVIRALREHVFVGGGQTTAAPPADGAAVPPPAPALDGLPQQRAPGSV